MKILVLGASGMIGHKIWQYLNNKFTDTYFSLHHSYEQYEHLKIFPNVNYIDNFNAQNFPEAIKAIGSINPDIIINAIGITIRKGIDQNPEYTKKINSDFPHLLAEYCNKTNSKLIHFSTDCVFSGIKTNPYTESDEPDADDLYGRSKANGEVIDNSSTMTIRASMIGRELISHTELLDWLLLQHKNSKIFGYTNAIYSGITTLEMAKIISDILANNKFYSGLYHVSSNPISKYELLVKAAKTWNRDDIQIEPREATKSSNKSLDSSLFQEKFNWEQKPWDLMLSELFSNN